MSAPELERYSLVVLRRPAGAPDLTPEEANDLQAAHLAYLETMREQGKLAVAGPFDDQPDESWRGLCLYVTSLEEARALAGRDPAVVRGRLGVDVLTWWVPKGELEIRGRRTRQDG